MKRGFPSAEAQNRNIKPQKSTFKQDKWVHVSRTLYVTNVPSGVPTQALDNLFKDLDGFIALRRVRSMCFVDFNSKQQATDAMWRTNGHKFSPSDQGLLVSYDKDDSEERGGWSMRAKEEERQRRAEADATRVPYCCVACNHFCFKLVRALTEMPERKTDRSRVVATATDLVSLACAKGGSKLLQREKGVEKQFRYNCELCDSCVAYKPVPYEQDSKYLYVFPEAVVAKKSGNTSTPLVTPPLAVLPTLPPPPPGGPGLMAAPGSAGAGGQRQHGENGAAHVAGGPATWQQPPSAEAGPPVPGGEGSGRTTDAPVAAHIAVAAAEDRQVADGVADTEKSTEGEEERREGSAVGEDQEPDRRREGDAPGASVSASASGSTAASAAVCMPGAAAAATPDSQLDGAVVPAGSKPDGNDEGAHHTPEEDTEGSKG